MNAGRSFASAATFPEHWASSSSRRWKACTNWAARFLSGYCSDFAIRRASSRKDAGSASVTPALASARRASSYRALSSSVVRLLARGEPDADEREPEARGDTRGDCVGEVERVHRWRTKIRVEVLAAVVIPFVGCGEPEPPLTPVVQRYT